MKIERRDRKNSIDVYVSFLISILVFVWIRFVFHLVLDCLKVDRKTFSFILSFLFLVPFYE